MLSALAKEEKIWDYKHFKNVVYKGFKIKNSPADLLEKFNALEENVSWINDFTQDMEFKIRFDCKFHHS